MFRQSYFSLQDVVANLLATNTFRVGRQPLSEKLQVEQTLSNLSRSTPASPGPPCSPTSSSTSSTLTPAPASTSRNRPARNPGLEKFRRFSTGSESTLAPSSSPRPTQSTSLTFQVAERVL